MPSFDDAVFLECQEFKMYGLKDVISTRVSNYPSTHKLYSTAVSNRLSSNLVSLSLHPSSLSAFGVPALRLNQMAGEPALS